jgi:hypothetical protein
MNRAVSLAAHIAQQRHAATVAFAPSLLDAGLDGTAGTPTAMLRGLAATLLQTERGAASRLAHPSSLRRWTFDAGIAHLESAEAEFRAALAAEQSQ